MFSTRDGEPTHGGVEVILTGPASSYAVGVKFANGVVREFCKRCGGTGHYSFNLMDGTVCYGCMGGQLGAVTTEADIVRRASNREKAAAKRAEKAKREFAAKEAAMQAWQAEHAPLMDALRPFLIPVDEQGCAAGDAEIDNPFLADLAYQANRTLRPLSDRQVETAWTAIERQRQRTIERAQQAQQQTSAGYVGQVGGKVSVTGEIIGTRYFEGDWNRAGSYLVSIRTDEGHMVKTFSSGEFGRTAEKGQRVTISGTVKAHKTYNDLPETTLTRVKALR